MASGASDIPAVVSLVTASCPSLSTLLSTAGSWSMPVMMLLPWAPPPPPCWLPPPHPPQPAIPSRLAPTRPAPLIFRKSRRLILTAPNRSASVFSVLTDPPLSAVARRARAPVPWLHTGIRTDCSLGCAFIRPLAHLHAV